MIKEYLLLGVLALVWGASYLFIDVALESFPPATLMTLRVLIAATLLWGLMSFKGLRFPPRNRWGALFVQSILNASGAWLLLAWGQQYTESGLAGVINSTSPIFVVIFSALLSNLTTPSPRKICGAVLGIAGVVFIIGPSALSGLGQNVAAQLAILAGAALYGMAAIRGRHFSDLNPIVTSTATLVWAAVVLLPIALIMEQPWTLSPSPKSLTALGALGIFSTAMALLIYFRLVNTLGSLGTASQAYLRAGISVALGVVILGERMSLQTSLGLGVVILAVILINWPAKRA